MPELRKDYVTNTWVVFSALRSQRPGAFRAGRWGTDPDRCPFCVGHEHMTPPEVLAYRKDGPPNGPGWSVRCIPNMYPALEPDGRVRREGSDLFRRVTGVGVHEIVIETPDHEEHLSKLSESQMAGIVDAYRERYLSLVRDKRLKYVLVFKNHGERAGATLSHPHSQIIATPIVPRRITEEIRSLNRFHESSNGACLFCRIIEAERADGKRIVSENESFLCVSPFAARFPFETWILPVIHRAAFEDLPAGERREFARILRDILVRMDGILDNPPFNYYIHTTPCDRRAVRYHWHVEVTPRLTEIAGFERGTDFYINPVMPEDAAAILRGQVKLPDLPT
jgi:UDPglucose--hexose-1-phosphate uridylyltransferase